MLAIALVVLAATRPMPPAGDGWAHLRRIGALSEAAVTVDIGTIDVRTRPPVFWFREVRGGGRSAKQVLRTDTRACPALLEALRAMRTLPLPRPQAPFLDEDSLVITADGVDYLLTVPAGYPAAGTGEMTLQSNVDTPLAHWIDTTIATLEGCAQHDGGAAGKP